jgi:hypothetical protein
MSIEYEQYSLNSSNKIKFKTTIKLIGYCCNSTILINSFIIILMLFVFLIIEKKNLGTNPLNYIYYPYNCKEPNFDNTFCPGVCSKINKKKQRARVLYFNFKHYRI